MQLNYRKIVIFGSSAIILASAILIIYSFRKRTDKSKNYIIGDSQTTFIDINSNRAKRISDISGKSSLWESGQNVSWLKNALYNYPISKDVNSIIVSIGTNGGFSENDDINGLVSAIRLKFPNAKLYVVQGSWGWGNNKDISIDKVNKYYNRFNNLGVKIIEPAIGNVDNPHIDLPIYTKIGDEIDKILL